LTLYFAVYHIYIFLLEPISIATIYLTIATFLHLQVFLINATFSQLQLFVVIIFFSQFDFLFSSFP